MDENEINQQLVSEVVGQYKVLKDRIAYGDATEADRRELQRLKALLENAGGLSPKPMPTVDDVSPAKLSPVGKLVKAVRFVKHTHTVNGSGDIKSYNVSTQTFDELMAALEGVEQDAIGLNLKGGSAK